MAEDGVWRTVGGRRIFIKDGEDLETAMKNSGKFNNDGKYTKTKMQSFLNDFKEKVENAVDNDEEFKDYNSTEKRLIKAAIPSYNNVVLNMRRLGLNIKDIKSLKYENKSSMFGVLAKFNSGNEIYIVEISKY